MPKAKLLIKRGDSVAAKPRRCGEEGRPPSHLHDDSASFGLNADLTPASNTEPDLVPKPSSRH